MSLPILAITVVVASWLVAGGMVIFAGIRWRKYRDSNPIPTIPTATTTTRRSMDR